MHKKLFFIAASLCILSKNVLAKDDSLVILNTNKAIEDTKPKSKAKLEPTYNITNVLNTTPTTETTDVYFSADEMQNDSSSNIITATGSVEIIRDNLTLRADKVSYDRDNEHIIAEGNVILQETSGNVIFADQIDITDKLHKADVQTI